MVIREPALAGSNVRPWCRHTPGDNIASVATA
jgi:hypothetical protein